MKSTVNRYLHTVRQRHNARKHMALVLLCLSVIVAGCVTWSLHLSGESLERQTVCGLEEHTHDAACVETALTCGMEEAHTHTAACYADSTLVCGMEESEEHAHTAECYADSTLTCGREEVPEHTHELACYAESKPSCGLEESAEHTHDLTCYAESEPSCGLKEAHTHTDECYTEEYVCGLEEHTHSEVCYASAGSGSGSADGSDDNTENGKNSWFSGWGNWSGKWSANSADNGSADSAAEVSGDDTTDGNSGDDTTDENNGSTDEDGGDDGVEGQSETDDSSNENANLQIETGYTNNGDVGDENKTVDYTVTFTPTTAMQENGFTIQHNFYLRADDGTEMQFKTGNEVNHFRGSIKVYGVDAEGNETPLTEDTDYTIHDNAGTQFLLEVGVNGTTAKSYSSFKMECHGLLNLEVKYDENGAIVETGNTIADYIDGNVDDGKTWTLVDDVTLYSTLNEDALTDENVVAKTQSTLHLQTEYVTDMAKVVTDIEIKNGDTVIDPATDKLYTNTDYTYTFTFKETTGTTNEKQFSDHMTYTLPTGLSVSDFSEQNLTVNGVVIGTYHVENNVLYVDFVEDYNGTGSSYAAAMSAMELSISITGQFSTASGDGNQKITIGDDLDIEVEILPGSGLTVDKKGGSDDSLPFDSTTMRQPYTATIKNTGSSNVTDISMTEVYDNRMDWDSIGAITVYDASGNVIKTWTADEIAALTASAQGTTTETETVENEDGTTTENTITRNTTTVSGLGTLEAGQYMVVEYYLKPNDDAKNTDGTWKGEYEAENVDNEVTINGNVDGEAIENPPSDDDTVNINTHNLVKYDWPQTEFTGDYTDGTIYTYVPWTVTIGNGSYDIEGTTVMDTLSVSGTTEEHTYCFGDGVTYSGDEANYGKLLVEINGKKYDAVTNGWVTRGEDGTSFTLTLPTEIDGTDVTYTSAKLYYYSKMKSPIKAENPDAEWYMGNTVTATLNDFAFEDDATVKVTPYAGISDQAKTATFSEDGNYAVFTITANIPGEADGTVVTIDDHLTIRNSNGAYYIKNTPEITSVVAEGDSNTYTFTDYDEDSTAAHTYYVKKGTDTDQFLLYFNGTWSNGSKWNIDEDTTLTVTYQIPLDAKVYGNNSGGTAIGTVRDYLEQLYTIRNAMTMGGKTVYAYLSQEPDRVVKSVEQVDEITDETVYKYTVDFYNYTYNAVTGEGTSWMDLDDLLQFVFTDTYDEGLKYFSNDTYYFEIERLKWSETSGYTLTGKNDNLRKAVGFSWTDAGTKGNIEEIVPVKDVVKDSESDKTITMKIADLYAAWGADDTWSYTMEQWWTNESYYITNKKGDKTSGINPDLFAGFEITYYLAVDETTVNSSASASTVKLNNTATVSTTNDSTKTASDTETVTYTTNVMTKTAESTGTAGQILYKIDLNPAGTDLMDDSDTLVVVDELPDIVSLVQETDSSNNDVSVKVYTNESCTNELDSSKWSWTLEGQTLKVTVPDETEIHIRFVCEINQAGTGTIDISNRAWVEGKNEIAGGNSGSFQMSNTSASIGGTDYQFQIQKVGQAEDDTTTTPLSDVTFDLYLQTTTTSDVTTTDVKNVIDVDGKEYHWVGEYTTGDDGEVLIKTYSNKTDSGWKQNTLSAGTYLLRERESTVPTGYQRCADLVFTFSTTNTAESSGTTIPAVNGETAQTSLTIYNDSSLNVTYQFIDAEEDGRELPETGGIGTTGFCLTGGLMAAGAAILLMVRRRVDKG